MNISSSYEYLSSLLLSNINKLFLFIWILFISGNVSLISPFESLLNLIFLSEKESRYL